MERRGLSALVAGDNQEMRGIIASVLTGLRVGNVRQAVHADDAFNKIRALPPSFIVIDFERHADTAALVRAIRRSPESPQPDVVIIATTAIATKSSIEAMTREGVDRILLKPVRTSALDSCIQQFVENERKLVLTTEYAGRERRMFRLQGTDVPHRRTDDPDDDVLDLDAA